MSAQGGITIEELGRAAKVNPAFLRHVLADEKQRGHVIEHDGRFSLAPEFAQRHGRQLAQLAPPSEAHS